MRLFAGWAIYLFYFANLTFYVVHTGKSQVISPEEPQFSVFLNFPAVPPPLGSQNQCFFPMKLFFPREIAEKCAREIRKNARDKKP